MKVRLGLVGLGNVWETRHRAALRSLNDRFEVRAICEPVSRLAEMAAKEFGAAAVDGFRVLTAREDIDAIVMLSAEWFGWLPILAACEEGKAVYCTAALDLSPEQARRIKGLVEQAGIAFVAEFPLRQAPATLRLKELIATQLGAPRLLFCHKRLTVNGSNGRMHQSAMRDMIEVVDWCRYVVGHDPTSVVGIAHASHTEPGVDDYKMMSLDFSKEGALGAGPVAQISCGRYMPAHWNEAISFRPPAALQVACERGVAFVDLPSTIIWFDGAGRHMESLDSERPVGEQLLLHFYRSVTSLVRNTASLEDAYRAQTIVVQAQNSFNEGRRISLQF